MGFILHKGVYANTEFSLAKCPQILKYWIEHKKLIETLVYRQLVLVISSNSYHTMTIFLSTLAGSLIIKPSTLYVPFYAFKKIYSQENLSSNLHYDIRNLFIFKSFILEYCLKTLHFHTFICIIFVSHSALKLHRTIFYGGFYYVTNFVLS